MNYINTRYNADKNYETQKYASDASAAAQRYAADVSAAAQRYASNRSYNAGSNYYSGYNSNTQNNTAEVSDILNTYKGVYGSKTSEDVALRVFLENQYPWVKDAYKEDMKNSKKKTQKNKTTKNTRPKINNETIHPTGQNKFKPY